MRTILFIQDPPLEDPKARTRRIATSVAIVLLVIVLAIATALLLKYFVFDTFTVDGISMYPTLDGGGGAQNDSDRNNGETLYLNKLAKINRGDIVVFVPDSGIFKGRTLVKRVIAVGGDHIVISENVVYLNGKQLDESYVNKDELARYDDLDVYIEDGYVFCMGDNRNHSTDCREFGQISLDCVVRRCFLIKGLDGKLRKA